jgi:hypothetical protein
LVAAEKTERRARLIEIDPRYVDVAILRWQRLTGKTAVNAATGIPFPMTPEAAVLARSSNTSRRTPS